MSSDYSILIDNVKLSVYFSKRPNSTTMLTICSLSNYKAILYTEVVKSKDSLNTMITSVSNIQELNNCEGYLTTNTSSKVIASETCYNLTKNNNSFSK